MIELLDPEVEWHPAFTALLGGETTVFRGHDGAREVIRQFWEVFSETHFEVSEIRDLVTRPSRWDDARPRSRKRRGDRIALGMAGSQQEGQATSIRVFSDPAEAIEAAGADE